jgi:hypothetical protein
MDIPDHLIRQTVKLYWCVGFVAELVNLNGPVSKWRKTLDSVNTPVSFFSECSDIHSHKAMCSTISGTMAEIFLQYIENKHIKQALDTKKQNPIYPICRWYSHNIRQHTHNSRCHTQTYKQHPQIPTIQPNSRKQETNKLPTCEHYQERKQIRNRYLLQTNHHRHHY